MNELEIKAHLKNVYNDIVEHYRSIFKNANIEKDFSENLYYDNIKRKLMPLGVGVCQLNTEQKEKLTRLKFDYDLKLLIEGKNEKT
jgi:hypothetical protein